MTPQEYTLGECLSATGLRELPKPLSQSDTKIWINAIVLVNKAGIQEYCIAANNGLGLPSIIRDFGTCRVITNIISIHPTESVSGKYTPDLRSPKAIITFLGKNGYNEADIESLLNKDGKTDEQCKKDRAVVQTYINQVAIKLARKEMAEQKRCREIKEYAENIKARKNGNKEING